MTFYKIDVKLKDTVDIELTKIGCNAEKNYIRDACDNFNIKNIDNSVFSITYMRSKTLVAVAAFKDGCKRSIESETDSLLNVLNMESTSIFTSEITYKELLENLKTSADNEFNYGIKNFLTSYKLKTRETDLPDECFFSEEITKKCMDKNRLFEKAKSLSISDDLGKELDRIFASKLVSSAGHPAHYIIVADDDDLIHDTIEVVTSALHKKGRLKSRRNSILKRQVKNRPETEEEYYGFIIEESDTISDKEISSVYSLSKGATVTIRQSINESREAPLSELRNLARIIKDNSLDTLSFVVFSKKDNSSFESFLETARNQKFVIFKEVGLDRDKAKAFLSSLAKEDGIGNAASLLDELPKDDTYFHLIDLKEFYSNWKTSKHPIESYPLYKDIGFHATKTERAAGSSYEKLQSLIGLDSVKTVINKALDLAQFQKLFPQACSETFKPSRHMVFAGNPGTAKTTVARLYAKIMKENEVLREGRLIEVGRNDLVGRYIGWTAKHVKEAFDKASGSVLFIDEAYSLVDDSNSFGDEAINTIVQFMENRKDDTVVIFAGYPDKMQAFLDKNPGLRSRIAFHVNFEDYSADELMQILKLQLTQSNVTMDQQAQDKAYEIIQSAMLRKDFGNGRFVRNLFESARMNHATRMVADFKANTLNENDVKTLKACDFTMPEELNQVRFQPRIGFAS